MFFAIVLYGFFGLGVLAAVVGLVFGIVRRLKDKRTPQERWADEHGDGDNPYRAGAQFVAGMTFSGRY